VVTHGLAFHAGEATLRETLREHSLLLRSATPQSQRKEQADSWEAKVATLTADAETAGRRMAVERDDSTYEILKWTNARLTAEAVEAKSEFAKATAALSGNVVVYGDADVPTADRSTTCTAENTITWSPATNPSPERCWWPWLPRARGRASKRALSDLVRFAADACCPGIYRRQQGQLPAGSSTGSFCSGSKQPYPAWCSHVRSPARGAPGLEQTPQSYRSSSARGTKNRQPDAQSG
jgi:hypothetical protein